MNRLSLLSGARRWSGLTFGKVDPGGSHGSLYPKGSIRVEDVVNRRGRGEV